MKVLHINDKIQISGGVEVYLEQLQTLLPQYYTASHWLGIHRNSESYQIEEYPDGKPQDFSSLKSAALYLENFISSREIDLINIHSISDPDLIRYFLSVKPVVRTAHEPRIFCPGHGKFFRYSEKICTVPFGLHCFWHAYTEGCTNRHPQRLLKAYSNTRFEIEEASLAYKKTIVMSDYMAKEADKAGFPLSGISVNPYFTPEVESVITPERLPDRRLLFIGRIISYKGLHLLIEALIPLFKEHADLYLDVAGDGMEYPQLKAVIKELKSNGCEDRVVFHGWQNRDEIKAFLRNSFLVVFPSLYPEAFGIVGIEAMMNGKPVVGFNVGGVSTWLKNGETGFLIENSNSGALRDGINKVLTDKETYTEFSINARNQALEKFRPKIHLENLIDIYQKALKIN